MHWMSFLFVVSLGEGMWHRMWTD